MPIAPRTEADIVASASTSPSARTAPAEVKPAAEPFQQVLRRLGREVDQGERLVERAVRGGATADAGELIALQAGIYRYTEAVELCSKVVDRVGAAVRTTLQNQG
ncbi:MAG: hypothetical protein R3B13_05060 [Polyangiaceae bacterium]